MMFQRFLVFVAALCTACSGTGRTAAADTENDIIVRVGETDPVVSVALDSPVLDMTVGESATLSAEVIPAGAQVEWTSTDPSVASVTGGVVEALSPGQAVIVAGAELKTAQCRVRVKGTFRQENVQVFSRAMGKTIETIVILPGVATGKSPVSCPVVYLLHGAYAKPSDWFRVRADLGALADEYGFIFVLPDGAMSWYVDSPVDKDIRYETFTAVELVEYVDAHYPTLAGRSGRAITGMSMGGHGAMYLALRHADTFGAVGSMSGCLDFRCSEALYSILDPVLGSHQTAMESWGAYTAIEQIGRIRDGELAIIIDCGSEDFVLQCTTVFHDALLKAGISHDYELRPGVHDDKFWHDSTPKHLDFFRNYFLTNNKD